MKQASASRTYPDYKITCTPEGLRPHDLRSHSPSVHHPSLIAQCSFAMNGMSPPQVPPDAGVSPQSWIPANRNSDFTDGIATSATTPSNTGSSEQRTPPAKRRRDERERTRVSRACDRCKKCVERFLMVLAQITELGTSKPPYLCQVADNSPERRRDAPVAVHVHFVSDPVCLASTLRSTLAADYPPSRLTKPPCLQRPKLASHSRTHCQLKIIR